jgi:hypothetical protein
MMALFQSTRLCLPFNPMKFKMDKATEIGALIIALSPIALAIFLLWKGCQ